MSDEDVNQPGTTSGPIPRLARLLLAIALTFLGIAYATAVVSGSIGKDQRLQLVDLALFGLTLVVVIVLIAPKSLDRLKVFKLGSLEIELLERVREKQAKQDQAIKDISLLLPLLLPQTERIHLLNIAGGQTAHYRGGDALRAELRRLRSMGLIRMKDDKTVGELTSGRTFNLSDYVVLTSLGYRWVSRIREIEQAENAREDDPQRSQ